jgi:hypothetical protein
MPGRLTLGLAGSRELPGQPCAKSVQTNKRRRCLTGRSILLTDTTLSGPARGSGGDRMNEDVEASAPRSESRCPPYGRRIDRSPHQLDRRYCLHGRWSGTAAPSVCSSYNALAATNSRARSPEPYRSVGSRRPSRYAPTSPRVCEQSSRLPKLHRTLGLRQRCRRLAARDTWGRRGARASRFLLYLHSGRHQTDRLDSCPCPVKCQNPRLVIRFFLSDKLRRRHEVRALCVEADRPLITEHVAERDELIGCGEG